MLAAPVTIGRQELDAAERAALKQTIGQMADPEATGSDLSAVPELLRDHVKDLLVDRVRTVDEFAAAIEQIGDITSKTDGITFQSSETIAVFDK